LWSSPNVHGSINTTGLDTTLDRDDYVRNRGYNNFIKEVLMHLEDLHGNEIRQRTSTQKVDAERQYVDQAMSLVAKTYWESGDPLNKRARIRVPTPPSDGPRIPIKDRPESGVFEEEEPQGGTGTATVGAEKKKSVRRKCPISSESIRKRPFGVDKSHLRYELGVEFGDPVVLVNSVHEAYRFARKTGAKSMRDYLTECIGTGLALYELDDGIKNQGRKYGSPLEISTLVLNRARSIVDAALRRGR
jgi:hypothetical protein